MNSLVAVPPKDSARTVTLMGENLRRAFAGFGMVQSFFVVVFKIVEGFFYLSEMPAVCV